MSRWLRPLVLAWALVLGACSSFDREWKAAARGDDPYGGAWDGHWTSEKHRLPNGSPAGGRLRCVFTRVDDAHYRARFRAGWLVFSTGYEVSFETQRRGRALIFAGNEDLGAIFGGVYRYEGKVTAQRFHAAFASRFDHGLFDMTRPRRLTP